MIYYGKTKRTILINSLIDLFINNDQLTENTGTSSDGYIAINYIHTYTLELIREENDYGSCDYKIFASTFSEGLCEFVYSISYISEPNKNDDIPTFIPDDTIESIVDYLSEALTKVDVSLFTKLKIKNKLKKLSNLTKSDR